MTKQELIAKGYEAIERGEREVDFTRCGISDDEAKKIAKAVEGSESLNNLSLFKNKIQVLGAHALGYMLNVNRWLVTLDLGHNKINCDGIWYIARALQSNTTLQHLNLEYNYVRNPGASYLEDVVKRNDSLQTLNLDNNRIEIDGARRLKDALKNHNLTLVSFSFKVNNFHMADELHVEVQRLSMRNLNFSNGRMKRPENVNPLPRPPEPLPIQPPEETDSEESDSEGLPSPLVALNRVRLMIVGEPNSGKTSFIRSLVGEDCDDGKRVRLANTNELHRLSRRLPPIRPSVRRKPTAKANQKKSTQSTVKRNIAQESRPLPLAQENAAERKKSGIKKLFCLPFGKTKKMPAEHESPNDAHLQSAEEEEEVVEEEEEEEDEDEEVRGSEKYKYEISCDNETAVPKNRLWLNIWEYSCSATALDLSSTLFATRGYFVIVFNAMKVHDEVSESIDNIKQWLHAIRLRSKDAPSVMLIGTYCDNFNVKDEYDRVNEILLRDTTELGEVDLVENGNLCFFPVNNLDPFDDYFANIRRKIHYRSSESTLAKTEYPARSLELMESLLKPTSKPYASTADVLKGFQESDVKKVEEVEELLELWHELGLIIYRSGSTQIITNPGWFLDKLAKVKPKGIRKSILRSAKKSIEMEAFNRSGVVSREILKLRWNTNDDETTVLIETLRSCLLLCNHPGSSGGIQRYIIPSVIEGMTPKAEKDLDSSGDFEFGHCIYMDFSSSHLPHGLFQVVVSNCATKASQVPEMSPSKAVLFLKASPIAFSKVESAIKIQFTNDEEDVPHMLAMVNDLIKSTCGHLSLSWDLMLQSPRNCATKAEFTALRNARETGTPTFRAIHSYKTIRVEEFDSFFSSKRRTSTSHLDERRKSVRKQ